MTANINRAESTTLAPDDAFAVLGNETRMEIMQTLGEADGPLSFSKLRDHVGMRDPGQFNYHLKQLVGHFVRRTDDGYTLHRTGERVVMSVLSGAVTDDPELEPTATDLSCWYCGAPIEVSYRQERATAHCTECKGAYGDSVEPGKQARLGYMYLPPAGVQNRTPSEVYLAALIWRSRDILAWANGICPHCSAPLDNRVRTCDDHDATDELCDTCDRRYGVEFQTRCTNCIFEMNVMFVAYLLANMDLRLFLIQHGFDPFIPTPEQYAALYPYDEEVVQNNPFEARFTFTIDGDSISLTVNENLNIVEVTRG